jgi:hypothetical protein
MNSKGYRKTGRLWVFAVLLIIALLVSLPSEMSVNSCIGNSHTGNPAQKSQTTPVFTTITQDLARIDRDHQIGMAGIWTPKPESRAFILCNVFCEYNDNKTERQTLAVTAITFLHKAEDYLGYDSGPPSHI